MATQLTFWGLGTAKQAPKFKAPKKGNNSPTVTKMAPLQGAAI
jgi:hypothetical protein